MTDTPDRFDDDGFDLAGDGDHPRLDELLAGYALGDLSPTEHVELNAMIDRLLDQAAMPFELVAAEVQQLFDQDPYPSLPEPLRKRILNDAKVHFTNQTSRDVAEGTAQDPPEHERRVHSSTRAREWFAWLCVAASLLIALGIWQGSSKQIAVLTPQQQRDALLADRDALRVDWTPGKTPFDSPVSGDVLWNSKTQTGFMRFVGMPKNDPSVEQYQLWIIDPARDDEPIDGGVFNVAADGEVVIPIDAKLRVISPAAFAVTIEKPGGVVVSTQERLPLLAAVN